VSSQHIVSKIARTFKPTDSTWILDCIEDMGWAIQAIGYHAGFDDKATEPPYLTVSNFRAKIPCDVERLKHVECLKINKANNNILNPDGTTPTPEEVDEDCPPTYKGIKMTLSNDSGMASISQSSPRTTEMDVSGLDNVYQVTEGLEYVITNFEKGLIKLYYKGFITDSKGMPCVIDDYNYKTCLEFYCLAQMILRGFKHPEIDFDKAMFYFERHRDKAENAVKVMGLDQAERFEASWNRYTRSINFGGNFFAGLEQQEYIAL